MMSRAPVLLLVGVGLAACAGHSVPVSQAPVPTAPPSAVVTRTPDTVASKPDSAAVAATVRSEDVEKEAVRLFGPEGRDIVAGADDTDLPPTFDINVTSYATNRRVLAYLEFFQVDARDRFAIWLSRLSRYEGMIRERLRAKGLPEDLVYLTLIESGLSNSAVSRARAVGMWQFVSGTGRTYGLEVDPWVDERRDPYKATDAAVNYLSDLVQRLGSVYLAAAAYNAGEGRIQRGVRHLPGQSDSLTDDTFFQLADRRYLRRETRDYVPKLIAAALIAKQPDRYGFTDIPRMSPLQFDEIRVPEATGLDVLARLADTTTEALMELNPQFVRGVTPPGREVTVRVPRGAGTRTAERFDTLPATSRITFVEHYVTRGQTLSDIAKQYRVSVSLIQGANPSLRAHTLRVGTRVVIPMSGRTVPGASWKSATADDGARVAARNDGGATSVAASHRVRRGETASQIARRYGVDLDALLDYNSLSRDSVIKAGKVLRIPPSGRSSKNQSE
jgi:membrane-bound lytic murein transglycosylase D